MASLQRQHGISSKRIKRLIITVVAFFLFIGIVALFNNTNIFAGKSYSMPRVNIAADVETDGSLHVTEQRTFNFSGDFEAVWWTFSDLPSNSTLKVSSIQYADADENGNPTGSWTTLNEVPFVIAWRDEGGPEEEAYSYDAGKDTVYAFSNASDTSRVYQIDYTVVNGVTAYKDIGEVYWKYIGDYWEESSQNVTCTISLPVPSGTTVTPGDNVRAWGHGPLDGQVSVGEDGKVTYTVSNVNAGQFSEARVVFPVTWLTNLPESAQTSANNKVYLDTVVNEEKNWSDQTSRAQFMTLVVTAIIGVVCLLLIAWALRMFFKYGKDYEPDFKDKYWRDVPAKGVHPAVIGRLWRWNEESNDDFTATLMHLSALGALRIDKGSYTNAKGKAVEDYYLTRIPGVELTSPIDQNAMDFLFETIGKGENAIWFESIKEFGKNDPSKFTEGMNGWQGLVSAEANKQDFFEMKGDRYHTVFIALTVAVAIAAAILVGLMENFISLIFTVPTAIVLGVIAHFMPRRTKEATNTVARCKALRNWLKDFSSLNERPPTDVKVWGEFMVYAFLFGVAKEAMRQLEETVPEVLTSQTDGMSMNSWYVPWCVWYGYGYDAGGAVSFDTVASDVFQTTLANTVTTAESALDALEGNGLDGFDNFGGGGGFSMGGGGGFGVGGGAR
ncbi:MAG: DUF2207 domain-containing protein [Eggerthellaceae bacterium]|jgi:uncharacterized membrane protein